MNMEYGMRRMHHDVPTSAGVIVLRPTLRSVRMVFEMLELSSMPLWSYLHSYMLLFVSGPGIALSEKRHRELQCVLLSQLRPGGISMHKEL